MPTPDARTRRRRTVTGLLLAAAVAIAAWAGLGHITGALTPPGCAVQTTDGGHLDLDVDQAANASTISAVAVQRRLPPRAAQIAIATAMQESKLRNLDHGDRDSLGLFQQRPSQGWGTAAQVRDPLYASRMFYDHLVKVRGYTTRPLTEVAQAVQRSGYPEAYAKHEAEAGEFARAFLGRHPAAVTCRIDPPTTVHPASEVARALNEAFGVAARPDGDRVVVPTSTPDGAWAIASWSVTHAHQHGTRRVAVAGRAWTRARDETAAAWGPDERGDSTATRVVLDLPPTH